MLAHGLVGSRSEAENWIRLVRVRVGGRVAAKPGLFVDESASIELAASERYVSRAGLKLAGAVKAFNLNFRDKMVLDVGSSTGGFTDFALQHGAKKVLAVDVGTDQLHPSLRGNKRIELYEKTDIRDFVPNQPVDVVVGDVSFISLREILPHVAKNIMQPETILVAMVKPQFEAGKHQVNKGVIKNDKVRRHILADFENWAKQYFVVLDKKDSDVAGAKGNVERFYKMRLAKY